MKPIEMIAWFTEGGIPRPLRYRIDSGDGLKVIKVDNIITMEKERLAGNPMLIFKCQSIIHGVEKLYELKYEVSSCKWFLYKI